MPSQHRSPSSRRTRRITIVAVAGAAVALIVGSIAITLAATGGNRGSEFASDGKNLSRHDAACAQVAIATTKINNLLSSAEAAKDPRQQAARNLAEVSSILKTLVQTTGGTTVQRIAESAYRSATDLIDAVNHTPIDKDATLKAAKAYSTDAQELANACIAPTVRPSTTPTPSPSGTPGPSGSPTPGT